MANMGHSGKTVRQGGKLARIPASDVKRLGWRGVMRTVAADGAVLVTNHDQPEAVILAVAEYAELLDKAKQADSRTGSDLMLLRRRFDERLAALRAPDAGEQLRSTMRAPARLRGRVKAGTSY
jgi:PHD/YefM family antitoxin component YafN of YafNO toxin-antitoxin module